jgi:hypothetical protein
MSSESDRSGNQVGTRLTCNHRHGTQGVLDTAGKGLLENEFGTSKDDDVFGQILEKGDIIETEVTCSLVSL